MDKTTQRIKQLREKKKLREARVKSHTRHSKKTGRAYNVRDYYRDSESSTFNRAANDYADLHKVGLGNKWYTPDEVTPERKAYRKAASAVSVHNVRKGVLQRGKLNRMLTMSAGEFTRKYGDKIFPGIGGRPNKRKKRAQP